jgi:hypothetical protein
MGNKDLKRVLYHVVNAGMPWSRVEAGEIEI